MGRQVNFLAETSSGVLRSLVEEVQIIGVLLDGATQSLAPPRRSINHPMERLLSSGEEFETLRRRQVTTEGYFFSTQQDFG